MTRHAAVLAALTLAMTLNAPALAGHLFHKHHQGTPPPGPPRTFEHTQARAGYPLAISGHAAPTRTPAYLGYYVGGGGGGFHAGDVRRVNEGTFGWDYQGFHLPRNVDLGWNHGRREQAGTGSYAPDRIESTDSIGFVINGLRRRTREGTSEP